MFGKKDLMRDFNEIHKTLKGPQKRDAAMLCGLVSNASSRGHRIMPEKSLTMKLFR